jgi:hypothetical protein
MTQMYGVTRTHAHTHTHTHAHTQHVYIYYMKQTQIKLYFALQILKKESEIMLLTNVNNNHTSNTLKHVCPSLSYWKEDKYHCYLQMIFI